MGIKNRTLKILLLILIILGVSAIALILFTHSVRAQATQVRFAKADGITSGDCASWGSACKLYYALSIAGSEDQIWVQAGIHKPTGSTTDRNAALTLRYNIAVYGGFAGTETELDQRDWQANLTILSGDIDDNDLSDPNGIVTDTNKIQGYNSYHVVIGNSTGSAGVLDGFVITAGKADGIAAHQYDGGGMYTFYSYSTFSNMRFEGNAAIRGGAIFNDESDTQFDDVTITFNKAGYGGGMYNDESSPVLHNTTFYSNTAESSGGGIYNDYSAPILNLVTFQHNGADYGGGMSSDHGLSESSQVQLTDVRFLDNTANNDGGGFWGDGVCSQMMRVQFSDNTASGKGGGMNNGAASYIVINNAVFYDNSASGDRGGGISDSGENLTLVNASFYNNFSPKGGGLYLLTNNVSLTNTTMSGNTAYQGGGIWNASSSLAIVNAILWGNNATTAGNQIYNSASIPAIKYSDVQGSGGSGTGWDSTLGVDGSGNVDNYPQFVNMSNGNLRLQLTSPVIDAGDNAAFPAGLLTDLDGNLRFLDIYSILDTGNGTPPIIDMGAYEASGIPKTYLPIIIRFVQ
jgi:hypothetical protein